MKGRRIFILKWIRPELPACLEISKKLLALPDERNEFLRGSDINALNLFFLRDKYRILIASYGGCLLRLYQGETENRFGYGFPLPLERDFDIGKDLTAVLHFLAEDAEKRAMPFRFCLCNKRQSELLGEALVVEHLPLSLQTDADDSDYVYNVHNLAHYEGHAYMRQRNRVKKFKREFPQAIFEKITPENAADAKGIAEAWYLEHVPEKDFADSLLFEKKGLQYALEHVGKLPVLGMILYAVNGVPSAFCIGSATTQREFDLHYCKVAPQYRSHGTMATIINFFAAEIEQDGYQELNLEEDIGNQGLRTMKTRLRPIRMEQKFFGIVK